MKMIFTAGQNSLFLILKRALFKYRYHFLRVIAGFADPNYYVKL